MSETSNVNSSSITGPVAAVPAPAPVPPRPDEQPATVGHISRLREDLSEFGHFVKTKFEELASLVTKYAPTVEAGATAVAAAIPGLGGIAATVEKVASVAAGVVQACCGHAHGPGACAQVCPTCKAKSAA